ncbi:hypothetical protein KW798_01180 [Candidatus Parcubacteria bacterium]|nr:hypothetical protein [Candidatus Parcubacteria bacterium]
MIRLLPIGVIVAGLLGLAWLIGRQSEGPANPTLENWGWVWIPLLVIGVIVLIVLLLRRTPAPAVTVTAAAPAAAPAATTAPVVAVATPSPRWHVRAYDQIANLLAFTMFVGILAFLIYALVPGASTYKVFDSISLWVVLVVLWMIGVIALLMRSSTPVTTPVVAATGATPGAAWFSSWSWGTSSQIPVALLVIGLAVAFVLYSDEAKVILRNTPRELVFLAIAALVLGLIFGPWRKIVAFVAIALLLLYVLAAYRTGSIYVDYTIWFLYVLAIAVAGLAISFLTGSPLREGLTAGILISAIFLILGWSSVEPYGAARARFAGFNLVQTGGMPTSCVGVISAESPIRLSSMPSWLPAHCNFDFDFAGGTLLIIAEDRRKLFAEPGQRINWPSGFFGQYMMAAEPGQTVVVWGNLRPRGVPEWKSDRPNPPPTPPTPKRGPNDRKA